VPGACISPSLENGDIQLVFGMCLIDLFILCYFLSPTSPLSSLSLYRGDSVTWWRQAVVASLTEIHSCMYILGVMDGRKLHRRLEISSVSHHACFCQIYIPLWNGSSKVLESIVSSSAPGLRLRSVYFSDASCCLNPMFTCRTSPTF